MALMSLLSLANPFSVIGYLPSSPVFIALLLISFGTDGGTCLLYTSDAADDLLCVDLGGRRIIKKKKNKKYKKH